MPAQCIANHQDDEGLMTDFSFVMTMFFLLLGPIKIIPAFARLTRDAEPHFKRDVAVKATLFAAVICAIVALLTGNFVAKYQLSLPAIQITGGLILLLAALSSIFPRRETTTAPGKRPSALQLALSPMASPVIVTPAGIAAIMVIVLLTAHDPGSNRMIATALAIVMVLNFLVMFFNDLIVRFPGLTVVLQLFGVVLVVVQVALAVQAMIYAFTRLGVFVQQ